MDRNDRAEAHSQPTSDASGSLKSSAGANDDVGEKPVANSESVVIPKPAELSGATTGANASDLTNSGSSDDVVFERAKELLVARLAKASKYALKSIKQDLRNDFQGRDEGECFPETDLGQAINEAVERLKFYKHPTGTPVGWAHYKRSFFTPEKKKEAEEEDFKLQEQHASEESSSTSLASSSGRPSRRVPSSYSREEETMGISVVMRLNELYSEISPDDRECALDVHSRRAGTQFENVDAIAADWQDKEIVELVSVEVKLKFGSEVVQQAANYCRFSHRVWIAVQVPHESTLSNACEYLRNTNPRLFEYVVELGLGIIACRQRGEGQAYDVKPVQWPRRQQPSLFEKKEFLRRYEDEWKHLGVLSPSPQVH